MADSDSAPSLALTPPGTPRELNIDIWLDEWVDYTGNAAQLEGEGLIPKDFEWPNGGAGRHWQAGGLEYWLRRCRPAGHKGPMRSWLALDHWCVRVTVPGRDYTWRTRREPERKSEALRKEYHRHTAAGLREFDAARRLQQAAGNDKAFQAFKVKVPGLIPPPRGRKRKSEVQQQSTA